MQRRRHVPYPKWVYSPDYPTTGEAKIIERVEDWPDGWVSSPRECEKAREARTVRGAEPVPMLRAEIVAALRDAGVTFQRNASDARLYEVLQEALRKRNDDSPGAGGTGVS